MRTILLMTALALCAGCKRGTKDTGPARDESARAPQPAAPAQPPPAQKDADKDGKSNWVTAVPGGKKVEQLPVDGEPGGKQPWNVGPPAGGFQPGVPGGQPVQPGVPPMPPVQPPGGVLPGKPIPPAGGPGAVVPNPNPGAGGLPPALAPGAGTPLGAAKKAVAMADMRDLQLFIDTASLVDGKMPAAADIYAALVQARSPAAALVKDGAIILTGARERESIWAFEARAYLSGGLAVSQNGVETLTADELKRRLGK